jgi:hypothetical protein
MVCCNRFVPTKNGNTLRDKKGFLSRLGGKKSETETIRHLFRKQQVKSSSLFTGSTNTPFGRGKKHNAFTASFRWSVQWSVRLDFSTTTHPPARGIWRDEEK